MSISFKPDAYVMLKMHPIQLWLGLYTKAHLRKPWHSPRHLSQLGNPSQIPTPDISAAAHRSSRSWL